MTRRSAADGPTPILFSDRGCPFTHRALALLDHLGVPVECREAPVGSKPVGVEQYSAASNIPLLVHGELVLTESRVITEYLAEYYGFEAAYPDDVTARSLHRHAITLVDRTIVPALFGRTRVAVDDPGLDDVLTTLEKATATGSSRPCLLALHVAPMWLRVQWWQPNGTIARAVQARPLLRAWLDAAIALACVTRTAPDRAAHLADLARARRAGLLGPT